MPIHAQSPALPCNQDNEAEEQETVPVGRDTPKLLTWLNKACCASSRVGQLRQSLWTVPLLINPSLSMRCPDPGTIVCAKSVFKQGLKLAAGAHLLNIFVGGMDACTQVNLKVCSRNCQKQSTLPQKVTTAW
jgi:hypothetical protein